MTTTNMGWTEPTTGASNDTWGDLLNAIIDSLDAHVGGLINGLTLSAAGSTATFGVAAGAASGITLASAFTKTTSAWGVGTGQGALDTGAIAPSTWYHIFGIQSGTVTDILASLSATAPTMPSGYTRKRLIGSLMTDGSSQWVKCLWYGDLCLWDVAVLTTSSATPATDTPTLYVVKAPLGIKTVAKLRVSYASSTAGDGCLVQSPGITSANASGANETLRYTGGSFAKMDVDVLTDTSSQVRASCNGAAGNTLSIISYGFIHPRGQY